MPQKRKDGSEYDHNYVELRLRAAIKNTPDEQAVLVALQLLWWWFKGEARGLDMIKAVLIDPDMKVLPSDDPAYQSQISEKGIKRALASLRKKGLVETDRLTNSMGYRGPMGFRMTVPDITYDEAYSTFLGRLKMINPRLWAQYASKKEVQAAQPTLFDAQVAAVGGPDGAVVEPPTTAPATEAPKVKGKHKDENIFWDHVVRTWTAAHGTPPEWPARKGFQEKLTAAMTRLGATENMRRWNNLQADPYTLKKTIADYVYNPDAWVTGRAAKGTGNARAFQQPEIKDFHANGQ